MKAGTAVFVSFIVVIALGALGFAGMYKSSYDTANNYEANINRLNKASESQLSTYTLKVQEQAQIPAMYSEDLQKTIKAYFEGRGKQDENFIRSFVTQNVPNLSPKMYENLMVTIDAGRDAFNNVQKQKIDTCSDYDEFRGKFWSSFTLPGKFPSKNIEKLCQVVSDARTQKAFDTGVQETIKFR